MRGSVGVAAPQVIVAMAVTPFVIAACAGARTPDFTAGAPESGGSCVEDCRLTVENQSPYTVTLSAHHGSTVRPLGVLSSNASQTFTVPRRVSAVVAEVSNRPYCRGPVRWRTDGTADFIVGGASCRP